MGLESTIASLVEFYSDRYRIEDFLPFILNPIHNGSYKEEG